MAKWRPGPGYKGSNLPAVQRGKRRIAPVGVDQEKLRRLTDGELRLLARVTSIPLGTLTAFARRGKNLSQAQHDALKAAPSEAWPLEPAR